MGAWQGRRALIISAAPCENLDYVRDILKKYPDIVIICADGGAKYAEKLNIKPDVIVADFDSSENTIPCDEVIKLTPEKDDTDTQHAAVLAIERGCKELILVCATGGRIDHMLSNLLLCEQVYELGANLLVIDEQNIVMFHAGGQMKFARNELKKYISLIPLDEKLEGVTMKGLKYPLENASLTRKKIISVSNEPVNDDISIEILSGKALIILTDDKC